MPTGFMPTGADSHGRRGGDRSLRPAAGAKKALAENASKPEGFGEEGFAGGAPAGISNRNRVAHGGARPPAEAGNPT